MKKISLRYVVQSKFCHTLMALGLVLGCAHRFEPVAISANANPKDEIVLQKNLISQAQSQQVDVLASEDFFTAKDLLTEAEKDYQDGDASNKVLQTIGYSKAYLNNANTMASFARKKLNEIVLARKAAIKAGANNFQGDLEDLDYKFKKMSANTQNIKPDDKLELQTAYLDLELKSIKFTKLSKLQNLIVQAQEKNASEITPKAYSEAIQKFNIAEKTIETDRHSDFKIDPKVREASVSITRVLTLLESEQLSRNQSPEQRAVSLETRDVALLQANKENTAIEAESTIKDNRLAKQNVELANSESENQDLKLRENEDLMVLAAADEFSNTEADVYRQDGNLIIRLKSMKFASGRSDLPSDSIAVLTKVKEVIKKLGPGDVVVEGHTDGIGERELNQNLSEKRAESVLQFFLTDNELSNNAMDSVGYGSTKPLASDKTTEGRAQNRRVDIVIKPQQTI